MEKRNVIEDGRTPDNTEKMAEAIDETAEQTTFNDFKQEKSEDEIDKDKQPTGSIPERDSKDSS